MPGLNIVIPRSGGTGPIVDPLHSAGVSGYLNRYVPGRLDQIVGSDITSIPDLGTANATLSKTGAGTAKLQQETGVKYAELITAANTTADYALTSAASTYAPQLTVALVARAPEALVRLVAAGSLAILRAGSGQFQLGRTNGASGTIVVAGVNGWVFLLGTVDNTDLRLRKDATESTGTLTTTVTTATGTSLGGNQGGATKAAHIAEAIVWGRVLDSTERTAVQTAMKAEYSVLT